MKKYQKYINNEKIISSANEIIIIKNDMQYICPSHEMIIDDGWEEYIENKATNETKLKFIKNNLINEINSFDQSIVINEFFLNNIPMWFDKSTRTSLMSRFNAEKQKNKNNTTIWYNNISFTINIEKAIQMLYDIELYAAECYDTTQKHIYNILSFNTIEDVEKYNYTINYPQKLYFTIEKGD